MHNPGGILTRVSVPQKNEEFRQFRIQREFQRRDPSSAVNEDHFSLPIAAQPERQARCTQPLLPSGARTARVSMTVANEPWLGARSHRSDLPLSEDPLRANQAPGPCVRPEVLTLNSTGQRYPPDSTTWGHRSLPTPPDIDNTRHQRCGEIAFATPVDSPHNRWADCVRTTGSIPAGRRCWASSPSCV